LAVGENTGAATTVGYGLFVNGSTGADTNYSAVFMNGNVGIGTTNPNYNLEVIGTGRFSGSLYLSSGTVAVPGVAFSGDGNTGFYNPLADNFGIVANGSEKLRIDSAGNVGIGTTNPTYNLQVPTLPATSESERRIREQNLK
jgi:hypothetical protein